MSDDLISRQKAIKAIHEELDECLVWDNSGTYTANVIENIIIHLPSAEPERTAKVENQYSDYLPYARFMASELRGNCGICGETVWQGEKYCHECGAKLDWSDDE